MDQIDMAILRFIRDTNAEHRIPVVQLEKAFPGARVEERLQGLWNDGLLVVYGFHRTEQWSVFITVDGLRTLAAEEQLAQEVARQAAQDAAKEETRKAERAEDIRRSKKQFYLGHLFTFLIGVATGLVVAWVTHLW